MANPYATVLITLDPALDQTIANSSTPEANVQKMVFSSMDTASRIAGLFDYYNEHERMHSPDVVRMLQASGAMERPIFVYQTTRNCEILLDVDTLADAIDHPDFGGGDMATAVEKLVEVIARQQQDNLTRSGGVAAVMLIGVELGEQGSREKAIPENTAVDGDTHPEARWVAKK